MPVQRIITSRDHEAASVRHSIMLALHRQGFTLRKIADVLGCREHKIVYLGILRAEKWEREDVGYRAALRCVEAAA